MENTPSKKPYLPVVFLMGLSFSLINLVTIQTAYKSDGSSLYGYGIPFPWLRFSQVSSMEYDIQLADLVLNWCLYASIIIVVWMILPIAIRDIFSSKKIKWALRIIGCLFLCFSCINILLLGKTFFWLEPLFGEEWTRQNSVLYVGFDRPYGP